MYIYTTLSHTSHTILHCPLPTVLYYSVNLKGNFIVYCGLSRVLQALPSLTHMSIMKMHQEGLVALTVSQNVDGLHRRSNINPKVLAELHGNTNLERCKKCGHEYMRDYHTRTAKRVKSHETARKCDNPKCRGDLLDSIVNFGENLPEHELTKAFNGAEKVCVLKRKDTPLQ